MTPDTYTAVHRAALFVDACWHAFQLADSDAAVIATTDAYLIATQELAALQQKEAA